MVQAKHLQDWLASLQKTYAENKQHLTELDAAIGDADHGINMARGFSAVREELEKSRPPDISGILNTAAMSLIRNVGGASGPLYGTFFLRAAAFCKGKDALEAADVVALFDAGLGGVIERGKAKLNDKTMVDALAPAVEAMKQKLEAGSLLREILREGVFAAEKGMKDTIGTIARKGRASYLGERSIGHQDPGATSTWLMLAAAAKAWEDL
ncbi:MAG: dihydroxyacetone kinase subunit L [Desulfobacteraceae bacterium]|nr:MAG: dihydroxyacetone kinase subunit L [Desulfobacteraceae bacterium]